MRKFYHFIDSSHTSSYPFVLFVGPLWIAFLIWGTVVAEDVTNDFYIILGTTLLASVGMYLAVYLSKFHYINTIFEGNSLILQNWRGKQVARYAPQDVVSITWKDRKLFGIFPNPKREDLKYLNTPNIVVTYKDGRKTEYLHSMEKYRLFIEDLEQWSGIQLPEKEARLKHRQEDFLYHDRL